jgi:hypothetical protein
MKLSELLVHTSYAAKDQLIKLTALGNKNGLYDAVDLVKNAFPKVFGERSST